MLANNGNGDPQVFRGNQIVEILNAADARNDGIFRIIPGGTHNPDNNPCGNTVNSAYNKFYIYAPSAQACSAGTCGAHMIVVAESPMFYMSLRDFDMPTATSCPSGVCSGVAGIDIDGTENDGKMISQGNKLLNVGEVDGIGYGIVALDNHFGQEQTWVTTIKSRAVMRTSMMTFGTALSANGSQNTMGFSHWEDYCGNQDPTDCYSDGTHLPFGLYHVGVWLRDGWGHLGIEDVTFNGPSYAGVMLDAMTGFTSGWTLKGLHFQNERTNQVNGGSLSYVAGNLCDIAIGFQSAAASVYIEQAESNALQGVIANVCIGGTNHLPLTNMPDWGASQYYPNGGMILPTGAHNPSNYVMEIVSPVVGATNGSVEPVWNTSGTSVCVPPSGVNGYVPGAKCADGGVTWEIIGSTYPNDTGPSSSNQVKIVNLTTQNGFGPAIFNSPTNQSWTDQSIADYTFQCQLSNGNCSSTGIDEYSSSLQHMWRVDQGIMMGGNLKAGSFSTNNAFILSTAPTISSGFGTSPSISSSNGTAAFQITVGNPSASSGMISLPMASTGWNCTCTDISTNSTTVFSCKQTASTQTSATIGNFTNAAVSSNWGTGDTLAVNCTAF